MRVMAREDEVENEQEVAQPTEADATEATVDEQYVEDVGDDVDDGRVGVILGCTSFCSNCSFEKKNIGLLPSCIRGHLYCRQGNPLFAFKKS